MINSERMEPAAAEVLARRTLAGLKRWSNGAA
jgi:hypothetical protein